jgi:hypothetical protein
VQRVEEKKKLKTGFSMKILIKSEKLTEMIFYQNEVYRNAGALLLTYFNKATFMQA